MKTKIALRGYDTKDHGTKRNRRYIKPPAMIQIHNIVFIQSLCIVMAVAKVRIKRVKGK